MPNYNVKNRETGEIKVEFMSIAAMEKMLAEDPNLDVVPAAVPEGDMMRLGLKKPDNHGQFRDVINHIRKNNPRNTIDGAWV